MSMKRINSMILATMTLVLCSCVQELAVIDYSFEFAADITYDSQADEHRLTLTRKSGAEGNQYKFVFTLDGEANVSLTDMNGMTHEGSFKDSFSEVSAKTYTLSKVAPGEHTLSLNISTPEYSQSLAVTYLVEDFSFDFDTKVLFDEKTKAHSLEVTLKEGAPTDTYTISFTIDKIGRAHV